MPSSVFSSPFTFPFGGETVGLGPSGFSYWGPLFPDYRGARYVKDAVPAELGLGNPLTSFDGPLEHVVLRALAGGTGGNSITVEFSDDSLGSGGEIDEDTIAKTVHIKFIGGVTTVADIQGLISSSSLVMMTGTWNPTSTLSSDDDEFAPTALAGGTDPIETQVTFWGPDFPDSDPLDTDIVPGLGPDGAATFALALEAGSSVAFAWSTEVQKFYDGTEKRTANLEDPIQTYRGGVFLLAADTRVTRARLAQFAAAGSVFLLGLPWEALSLSADADLGTIPVFGLDECDWANPGQRVLILASDGAYIQDLVIQSVDDDELVVHPSVDPEIARYGSRIMPAMAVYLDAKQGFARYPHPGDAVEQWMVVARAALFGFSSAGVRAALALGPPVTDAAELAGAIVRARQFGTTGNIISIRFVADAGDPAGELEEEPQYGIVPAVVIGYLITVHYVADTTTLTQLDTLLDSGELVRLAGTFTGTDVLTADAAFGYTALTGGEGESVQAPGRGATLARFGGVAAVDGVQATLELGPITGGDNALQGAIITSRAFGGNLIFVTFIADEDAADAGEIEEDEVFGFDGSLIAQVVGIKFHPEVTTADDITILINNLSTFVTMGGPMTGGVLQAGEDEFTAAQLSGGVEAVAEVLGRPIWDRGVDVDANAPDSMQSMVRLIELGGVATSFGTANEPDWGRHVSLTSSLKSEWQWLKLFLHTIYGGQKSFYLPTWRADLVAIGDGPTGGGTASGTLTVDSNIGDIGFWFPTKRQVLQIFHDDDRVSFVLVTEAEDNGDGTTTLSISANPGDPGAVLPTSGPIAMLSWLEICRFDEDTFEVSWSGATFSMTTTARAVQR